MRDEGVPNAERDEAPEIKHAEHVGFRHPPKATRFAKGKSGNPKGRPKGSLNVASVFLKTLREKVVINENGQRKTITKLEAALKQLTNKAASGDLRALRVLVELANDAEAKQNAPGSQNPVLEDVDQEVIEGILARFVMPEERIEDPQGEERRG